MNVTHTQRSIKNIIFITPGIYKEAAVFDVDTTSHKLVAFGSILSSKADNFINSYKTSGIFMLREYCSDNRFAYRLSGISMSDSNGELSKEVLKIDNDDDSLMVHTLKFMKTALTKTSSKLPNYAFNYGTTKTPYEIAGSNFLLDELKPSIFQRLNTVYAEFLVDTDEAGLNEIFYKLQPIDNHLTVKHLTYGRLAIPPAPMMGRQWFAASFYSQEQLNNFIQFLNEK